MITRVGTLLAISAAMWAALAFPARMKWGDSALLLSGVAALLCLVPTTLTLIWASWARDQQPNQQLLLVVGGTGIRMFIVLGVGLGLYQTVDYLQEQGPYAFWGWILVFYLFTLALEVVLLLVGQSAAKNSRSIDAD
ncbi:MAG: hypothetical protein K2R98_21545 [Gemmataceae bacterium]|nr:hypothetical protein [Gemmataceae bacterium]